MNIEQLLTLLRADQLTDDTLDRISSKDINQITNYDHVMPDDETVTMDGKYQHKRIIYSRFVNLTLLHVAICLGNCNAVQILLEHGADPTILCEKISHERVGVFKKGKNGQFFVPVGYGNMKMSSSSHQGLSPHDLAEELGKKNISRYLAVQGPRQ